MEAINSPRGTRDLLPAAQPAWLRVKEACERTAVRMGFAPITVPTYEETRLFARAVGETTDIAEKELFLVRGVKAEDDAAQYALRPEGTAGIVRAYIQNGMHVLPQPLKLYSTINVFRYDRPQKGRYREFWQFDLEYFGDEGAFADAWTIYASWRIFKELGLENLELKLNSLGTPEERETYKQALISYYEPIVSGLSDDAKRRLHANPLRLIDSKDERDLKARENAPRLSSFLSEESASHFAAVQEYLTTWKVPYVLDDFLVRGLDYYCHTAFEWTVKASTGQQGSLGGGGRYDGLVPGLGGRPTGAVGLGLGLDRVVEELERQGIAESLSLPVPDAFVVAADPAGAVAAPGLVDMLLDAGFAVEANLSKDSVGGQLKSAAKTGARYAVILGEKELEQGTVVLKNMADGEQRTIPLDGITERIG